MERKRAIIYDDDEEDEVRRMSPRDKKRITYIEDEDDDNEEEEEEEEDEVDNEQPDPSTQSTHKQRKPDNRLLTVTCGNKTAVLDVEKLNRGEECIECKGRWFAPPAFEEFGGKGCSKKWKTSISYDNKPLQFWFEQGHLTTKGFKRRGTATTKKKKILSPNHESESSSEESEIQSAKETKEDDVKGEDRLPSSAESVPETEGERAGADASKEQEDEMEDEDVPADNNNSVFEEREVKSNISTPNKSAFQREVKVVIKRLPELHQDNAVMLFCCEAAEMLCGQRNFTRLSIGMGEENDCQSSNMEHLQEDSRCKPPDEDAHSDEEREHSGLAIKDSSITAATQTDHFRMSDLPIIGGAKEEEEFTQSNEREEDGQNEIKTETGNSPTPPSVPATSSPDIKPGSEDNGSTSSHIGRHTSSPVLHTVTDTISVGDMTDGGPATKSLSVQIKYKNTDDPTFSQDAAQLQVMKLVTRGPQTAQASDIRESDLVEAPSCRPSTSCDLDTMALDQLRREKIKMQIKVLRLQEDYYTQKIQKLKK